MINTSPSKIRGWTHVLRCSQLFLLHQRHQSCYFFVWKSKEGVVVKTTSAIYPWPLMKPHWWAMNWDRGTRDVSKPWKDISCGRQSRDLKLGHSETWSKDPILKTSTKYSGIDKETMLDQGSMHKPILKTGIIVGYECECRWRVLSEFILGWYLSLIFALLTLE